MARKGENIRKRKDGRWEARYEKGRNPDGSIQYGYVYARKYSDVKSKRNMALQNLEKENSKRRRREVLLTFEDLLNEWKAEIRHNVKDSSYFFYEIIADHHLRPYFGNLQIMQLTSDVAQNFVQCKYRRKSFLFLHSFYHAYFPEHFEICPEKGAHRYFTFVFSGPSDKEKKS